MTSATSSRFDDASSVEQPLAESGFTTGWFVETLYDNSQEFRDALGEKKIKSVTFHCRLISPYRIYTNFQFSKKIFLKFMVIYAIKRP